MSEAKRGRREQILDAALSVFGRYGYQRTSMDSIARAAKVSRPALYQHFSGKGDVFRAMAERLLGQLADAAEAAGNLPGGSVADRLHGALAVKLHFFAGTVDAQFRSEMLAEAADVADDLMASFRKRHLALVEDLLSSAQEELDLLDVVLTAHDTAALLLAAVAGISQQRATPEVLDARLRQMVELTVRGLTTSRPFPA